MIGVASACPRSVLPPVGSSILSGNQSPAKTVLGGESYEIFKATFGAHVSVF